MPKKRIRKSRNFLFFLLTCSCIFSLFGKRFFSHCTKIWIIFKVYSESEKSGNLEDLITTVGKIREVVKSIRRSSFLCLYFLHLLYVCKLVLRAPFSGQTAYFNNILGIREIQRNLSSLWSKKSWNFFL